MQGRGDRPGIGGEQAGRAGGAPQAVFFLDIAQVVDAARVVQRTELLGLHEAHAGLVPGSADRQLVGLAGQVPLHGGAGADLAGLRPVVGTARGGRIARPVVLVIVVHVAVQRPGARLADIDGAAQALAVAQPQLAVEGELGQVVTRLVGAGEDRFAALAGHRLGQQPVADQAGAGLGQRQVGLAGTIAKGQLAEELLDVGRRIITPAIFAEPVAGHVPAERAVVAAVFQFGVAAPEAAAGQFELAARMRKTALGADGQCTAQGVEAEGRVGAGDKVDAGNGRMRNQIPIHRIAEGLVHPHAIDVDRQPLGRAKQRRGGEAAVVEVGLVRIALGFIDRDGRCLAQQLFGDVEALDFLQALVVERHDVGRQVQARHANPGQRRGADHFDGGGGDDGLGVGRRESGGDGKGQQGALGALSLHVVFLSL